LLFPIGNTTFQGAYGSPFRVEALHLKSIFILQRKEIATRRDGNTFKVKAMNNDRIWSKEITSLQITILPPFWATGWAIVQRKEIATRRDGKGEITFRIIQFQLLGTGDIFIQRE